jgi:hypothetical protein
MEGKWMTRFQVGQNVYCEADEGDESLFNEGVIASYLGDGWYDVQISDGCTEHWHASIIEMNEVDQ